MRTAKGRSRSHCTKRIRPNNRARSTTVDSVVNIFTVGNISLRYKFGRNVKKYDAYYYNGKAITVRVENVKRIIDPRCGKRKK